MGSFWRLASYFFAITAILCVLFSVSLFMIQPSYDSSELRALVMFALAILNLVWYLKYRNKADEEEGD